MPGKRGYNTKAGFKVASKFEVEVVNWLTDQQIPFDYEAESLSYTTPVVNGACPECGHRHVIQERVYTPDIRLMDGTFIEIKGKFTPQKRNLMRHLIKANPDRTIRFVFFNDPYLTKRKATRLSDWARQQGVEYHVWSPKGGKKAAQHWLPEEWFNATSNS